MKIHIITRCTRPENLVQVRNSIFDNIPNSIEVIWNVVFDCAKIDSLPSELLHEIKCRNTRFHFTKCGSWKCQYHFPNQLMTMLIRDGFVYFVDDDNILHPNFYTKVFKLYADNPDSRGFIFSQWVGGKDFSGLDVRVGSEENVKVGSIDLAQYMFSWKLPFEYQTLFGDGYCGDGDFIVGLFDNGAGKEFAFTDEILSFYNYITEYGDTPPEEVLTIT